MILANLPKQYQEAAKGYIQQTVRSNISGKLDLKLLIRLILKQISSTGTNSPSSPLSSSSPKPLLSPQQFGQFNSLQHHISSELIEYTNRL